MSITCNYKFPAHPSDMMGKKGQSDSTRVLRCHMIQGIAEMSQNYDQETLDKNIFVDVDDDGIIIGMDLSQLLGIGLGSFCVGNRVPLGMLTKKHWYNMKYSPR